MFIRTKDDRIINADKVIYFEIITSLNTDGAQIDANLAGNKTFKIFDGPAAVAKTIFCKLADALSDGTKTMFDIKDYQEGVDVND